jgi:hypothetical protein
MKRQISKDAKSVRNAGFGSKADPQMLMLPKLRRVFPKDHSDRFTDLSLGLHDLFACVKENDLLRQTQIGRMTGRERFCFLLEAFQTIDQMLECMYAMINFFHRDGSVLLK